MDKIARVRQEIEERKKAFQADVLDGVYPTYYCALLDIEDFLDTLSEEPDESLEDAAAEYEEKALEIIERNVSPYEEELNGPSPTYSDAFIAGAEWQKKHLEEEIDFAQQLRKLQESQRKANLEDYINVRWGEGNLSKESFKNAIKGAFEIGMEKQKEQMLKDAMEADVNTYKDLVLNCGWVEFVVDMPSSETDKFGDKVRIVVLKEEE